MTQNEIESQVSDTGPLVLWLISTFTNNVNFRFADDIVVNTEEEEEADILADRLDTTKWTLVQKRRKWWKTTQMASKERSR